MKGINQQAPARCGKTITILAGRQKVWETLTSIDQWTTWNPGIKKAKLKGRLEPGARFDWKTGGVNIRSALHTVEPFQYLGWTGKALGTRAIHNWTLNETNGQTTVLCEESLEGWLVRMFRRAFGRNLENGMQQWLGLLKQKCEADALKVLAD